MNNIKYYNDSLAYDFEMFAEKPARQTKARDNIVVLPNNASKSRSKAAAKSMSSPVLLIMTVILVLSALCGNIALRLQINEVNSSIKEVKASIGELDSEKTALEMEMQRRIAYANLEVEATKLGMKKLEKENVKYIRVNDKNTARTSDGTMVTEE